VRGAGEYVPADGELFFTTGGLADQPITFTTYNGKVTIRGKVTIQPGGDHLRFHGFTLTGYDIWGISVDGVQDIVLSGLDISGGDSGIHLTSGDGTDDESAVDSITVQDSVIHDVIYSAVDCTPGPCNNMIFRRLEIFGAGLEEANYGSDGLALERGKNILVEDCFVHDNSGDGIDLNSRDKMRGDDTGTVIVRRNRVEHNALNGIKAWGGGEISNNLTWGNGDTSLVIQQGSDYVISNNTFASPSSYVYLAAIGYDEFPGETHVTLYNNIFYNDDPEVGATLLYVSSKVRLDADYNLFFNPFREEDVICGEEVCFSAEQINDGTYFAQTGFGEHSLYGDPQFLDAANGDFHLAETSPALDAGDSKHAPADDLETTPRPVGDGVDIGAYKHLTP